MKSDVYVLRLINNLKKKVKCEDQILNNYVLPEEMKQSLIVWLKRPPDERIFTKDFIHTCHSFYILSSPTRKNIESTNLERIHEGSFYVLFFN